MRVRVNIGDFRGYWSTGWTGDAYFSVDGCTMGLPYNEYGSNFISNSWDDVEISDMW
jgi:hypothetical protein